MERPFHLFLCPQNQEGFSLDFSMHVGLRLNSSNHAKLEMRSCTLYLSQKVVRIVEAQHGKKEWWTHLEIAWPLQQHEYMITWFMFGRHPSFWGQKKLRYQRMHHTFWSNFDARFWKTGWWFYEQMRGFGELLRDILGKPRFRWPKRGCIWEVHGMKLKAQWRRNGRNEARAGVAQIGSNIS